MIENAIAWTVIGAGPAGIAALAKLLDSGVDARNILWIDPEFAAGDFGTKWQEVSGNTRVKFFTRFLESSPSFNYVQIKDQFALSAMDAEETCLLKDLAEPLCVISQDLRHRVHSIKARVDHLSLHNYQWQIETDMGNFSSTQVILATGAAPKSLHYDGIEEIKLADALHPEKLLKACQQDDSIAVFGSSHSAILIIKALCELGVKKVVNFYKEPLCFAVPQEDWILFDNTGLKGVAAKWARENLNGVLPKNLLRIHSDASNMQAELALCNKAVYAVGFKTRAPKIRGLESLAHNPHNGIIAPGLFGVGIGFPEQVQDPFGHQELSVGVFKFMDYLSRIMPLWLKYIP